MENAKRKAMENIWATPLGLALRLEQFRAEDVALELKETAKTDDVPEASLAASPLPKPQAVKPARPWPVACLIPSARNLAMAAANAIQVPVDLAAMSILGTLASACRADIEWKPGCKESSNLYLMTACEPSERKSTMFTVATTPLYTYESEQIEVHKPLRVRWEIEGTKLQNKIGKIGKASGGVNTAFEASAESLAQALTDHKRNEPIEPMWIVDNITPESLEELLAKHHWLSMMSTEGNIVENISDVYKKGDGSVPTVYKKAWSGDRFKTNRMSRQLSASGAYLNINLTVQHQVLQKLASVSGAGPTGFLSKPLYSVPDSMVGDRLVNLDFIPLQVKDDYNLLVRRLASAPWRHLTVTTDAQTAILAFNREIEGRMNCDLSTLKEWAGKLQVGQVCRIASVLHCCEQPTSNEVGVDTIKRAVALARYFICHAKIAFGKMDGADAQNAAKVRAWIIKKGSNFTLKELSNGVGRLKGPDGGKVRATAKLLKPLLSELTDFGEIKPNGTKFEVLSIRAESLEQHEEPGEQCPEAQEPAPPRSSPWSSTSSTRNP